MISSRSSSAVIDALKGERDGLTRAQLVSRAGLSHPTVSKTVQRLLSNGVLEDVGRADAGATRVALSAAGGLYLGLDLGHRHVACAVATGAGDLVLEPMSWEGIEIDRDGLQAVDQGLERIADALAGVGISPEQIVGIGVGVPAPLDPEGHVAASEYVEQLEDLDVGAQVLEAYQRRFDATLSPVVTCDNDANLGTLGEARLGVASDHGHSSVLYVKASTGVGSGLLLDDGRLWRGGHGLAGELGHSSCPQLDGRAALRPLHPRCPRCDKTLCLQNLVGSEALLASIRAREPGRFGGMGFDDIVDAMLARPAEHLKVHDLLEAAGAVLGAVIADVSRMIDPDVVVIGGQLARAGEVVARPIREAVSRAGIGRFSSDVVLVAPEEVRFSEARGAVMLAIGVAEGALVKT